MSSETEPIGRAVIEAFPARQVPEALNVLAAYGVEDYERERERVQRAIVALSRGDMDKLRHFVALANTDYRDVLYWAETPDPGEPG